MRQGKKSVVLCVILLSFLLSLGLVWAGPKTVTLKYSDIGVEDSTAGAFTTNFARLVEEKTQGRVRIEIYWGGTLTGNDIEGTQTGIADFSQHDVSEVDDLCPLLSLLEAPYLFESDAQLYKLTGTDSPLLKRLNDCLKGSNVRMVSTYSWGNQHILTTKKPVYKGSDLKGLKIRCMPSRIFMETLTAMGATPTPMSWSEVVTSLVTGVIDGTAMPFIFIVPGGLHEIVNYVIMTGQNPTLSGVFMNEDAWTGLSPEDQKQLTEAATEARKFVIEYNDTNMGKFEKTILEKGVKIIRPDEIQLDKEMIREKVFNEFRAQWGDLYHEVLGEVE